MVRAKRGAAGPLNPKPGIRGAEFPYRGSPVLKIFTVATMLKFGSYARDSFRTPSGLERSSGRNSCLCAVGSPRWSRQNCKFQNKGIEIRVHEPHKKELGLCSLSSELFYSS